MAIEKVSYDDYEFVCDGCGDTIMDGFESWHECKDWKLNKDNKARYGYQAAKSLEDEWADFCVECVQAGLAQKHRDGDYGGGTHKSSVRGKPPGRDGYTEEKKFVPPLKPSEMSNPFEGFDDIK